MKLKLYKYLRYEDGAKAILDNGTMKFSQYDEFNDPFDCKVSYDIEDSINYAKTRRDLLKAAGDKLGLSPAERISKKSVLLKNIENSILNGDFHHSLLEKVGICCFSITPDNILMWSHYANNHTGIVLEFDTFQDTSTELDDVESLFIGYPVKYEREMPRISVRNGQDGFDAVQQVLLTKSDDWKYENEFRVLSTSKGPGIHHFDHKLISKVILGAKMKPNERVQIQNQVSMVNNSKDLNIQISEAQMNSDRYEINIT